MESTNKVVGNRVGVFADVRGLYFCALHSLSGKVHYGNLLKEITQGRTCVVANAYIIARKNIDQRSFFSALKKYGYNIKKKEERIVEIPGSVGKTKISKVNWYVGISIDVIDLVLRGQIDTVCLIAGDGQLADLVTSVVSRNCRCELYWFDESRCSKLLRDNCSSFYNLPESLVIKHDKKLESSEIDTTGVENVLDNVEGITEEELKRAEKEIDEEK